MARLRAVRNASRYTKRNYGSECIMTAGRNRITFLTWMVLCLPARADAPKIDFSHDIVPILKARCAACHTNGKYKGSFSLDTRDEILKQQAVVPGKSAASELFKRVTSTDPKVRMPAKGEPLTAKQIALL